MNHINWGVIGTGDVMEIKSGPGLYKAENSSLRAVFNRTPAKAQDYARRHGVSKVHDSAEALIADDEVDVVYIATPPVSHKHYALMALEAGKIPYIEKPLAINHTEALEIQSLASKRNLPVYVAFYRRGLEKFLKIKTLLDEQAIGQVRFVKLTQTAPITDEYLDRSNLPWRVLPEISGGGLFLDIGSHLLDCLMLYFGELETMDGMACNKGGYFSAEDTVMSTFRFKNGVVGAGSWCFVADEFKNEVEIIGDKGRIIYDGLSAKRFSLVVDGEERNYEFEPPTHIAMPYQQTVINELLGQRKSHANFDHAVNLAAMMDRILMPYHTQFGKP